MHFHSRVYSQESRLTSFSLIWFLAYQSCTFFRVCFTAQIWIWGSSSRLSFFNRSFRDFRQQVTPIHSLSSTQPCYWYFQTEFPFWLAAKDVHMFERAFLLSVVLFYDGTILLTEYGHKKLATIYSKNQFPVEHTALLLVFLNRKAFLNFTFFLRFVSIAYFLICQEASSRCTRLIFWVSELKLSTSWSSTWCFWL